MISQRYLPGCGSSWDQNQRRYATLEPGKSIVPDGASGTIVSGPTSDHVTPSFNGCPEKRLNVSMPIPGFTRMSSISVGRTTVVCAATTNEQNKTKGREIGSGVVRKSLRLRLQAAAEIRAPSIPAAVMGASLTQWGATQATSFLQRCCC